MSENILGAQEDTIRIYKEEILGDTNIFGIFNKVRLSGIIEANFKYSHKNDYDRYYNSTIRIPRRSGTEDHIPIVVPYSLIKDKFDKHIEGMYARIAGCIRTRNALGADGRKHLNIFVYVKCLEVYESQEEARDTEYDNFVYLNGGICKIPTFRTTPLGRQISDLMVAVRRSYPTSSKADYIPCVAWGSTAKYASELNIGDRIEAVGRIQSREYTKRNSPNSQEGEIKVAYEVSIMRIE